MGKRKLLHYLFILALFSTTLFNFCKKERSDAANLQTPINENLITKIKSWLDEQKNGVSAVSAVKIDSLKLNLSYGEIRLEQYKESKQLIVIPILGGFKSRNNSDKNPANYLVLVFENQDSIIAGNIIQYISSNSQRAVPQNTFSKIFTYQDLDCSGQFTVLSTTDYFQYELKFDKGKIKSMAWLKKNTPSNSGSHKVNECIDWYLQTWYVWSDGTVQLVSEVYVGTSCDGDCWQPKIANGRIFRINDCGGSGGGGGGGENCCLPAGFQLSSSSISETLSDNCGIEGADPSTGLPVKSCLHSWRFSRNTLAFYTWSYISREESELEKINGVWKFKTVQHAGMDIDGTIPPCISFSCNIGSAIPSISTSNQLARMDITYTTTLNVTCCRWCSPTYSTNSAHSTWNSQ